MVNPKQISIVVVLLILIVVFVSVIQAQRTTIPPLPDLNRVSAPPNATPTAKPSEKRPEDILIPVTPIPSNQIIDKTGVQVPIAEKTMYVVRKENGEYVKIFVAPEQFREAQGQDIHSILELSEGDKVVSSAPPLNLMQRQIPHPNKQSVEVAPIHYKEVIDMAGEDVSKAEKATFIIRRKNGDYVKILVSSEQFERAENKDPRSILELSEEDRIVDFIPPLKSTN